MSNRDYCTVIGRGFYGIKRESDRTESAYSFCRRKSGKSQVFFIRCSTRKAGYEQIGAIFDKTALNELAHASMWLKELGMLQDTAANLKSAAEANIMNGQICMKNSPRLLNRKDFKAIAA